MVSPIPKLTREQAAIVGLYTGITCGPFADVHKLAEELTGEPIWTFQFAHLPFVEELKERAKPLFLGICYDPPTTPEGERE